MAPEDVHRLILGTWEYVTLLGKTNFSDEIKVMGLEMRHCFELVEWMKSDHKTLKSREARETHREQGSAPTAGLEKGGVCMSQGLKTGNGLRKGGMAFWWWLAWSWGLESHSLKTLSSATNQHTPRSREDQEMDSPWSSQQKRQAVDILAAAQWDRWRTPDLQNCGMMDLCCFNLFNLWWFIMAMMGI